MRFGKGAKPGGHWKSAKWL